MNEVRIVGPKSNCQKIWKEFTEIPEEKSGCERSLDFNKIDPTPKALKNDSSPPKSKKEETEKQYEKRMERRIKKYGAKDWYDWQVKNWGTKWSSFSAFYAKNNGIELLFGYNTAWGPGNEALRKLSALFLKVNIELEYFEPGMMFAGKYRYKAGKILDEYYTDNEEVIKDMRPDDFLDE